MSRFVVHTDHAAFLARAGLTGVDDFLALRGTVISGHPNRQVERVTLEAGSESIRAYLKREHHVPWNERIENALAGFGLVSKSWREARILRQSPAHAPQWLAAGEDNRGRAFLLLREIPDAVDLVRYTESLGDHQVSQRRRLARAIGAALAIVHAAGFYHADLYTSHLLVHPLTQQVTIVDWQRARRSCRVSWRNRCHDLAALSVTLPATIVGDRDRLCCLHAYLDSVPDIDRPSIGAIIAGVQSWEARLQRRRHVRAKRLRTVNQDSQSLLAVDGEELQVTEELLRHWPIEKLSDLKLLIQCELDKCAPRRIPLLFDRAAVLIGARHRPPWTQRWHLARRRWISPERRRMSLLHRLQRYGIEAPTVLAVGDRAVADDRVESFLLFLPPPIDASAKLLLPSLQRGRRAAVLRDVGMMVARLHSAGCLLAGSAGSISLRRNDDLYDVVLGAVDGLRVHRRRRWRDLRRDFAQVIRDLALPSRADCLRVLKGYFASLRESGELPIAERAFARQWLSAVSKNRASSPLPQGERGQEVSHLPLPAVMTESTQQRDTFWMRLLKGARRFLHRADWTRFVAEDWSDHVMSTPVTDRFHAKQGRSTGRLVIERPNEKLVIYLKRHYRLPWWRGLLATVWPKKGWSPALQEQRHLEWARAQGLPVPDVVAAGEQIGPWGRLQSFLAVEELTDMLPLHEAIPLAEAQLDGATFARWKRTLIAELVRLVHVLHDQRHFHRDLYLCHFFIRRESTACLADWRGNVHLIDLHRLAVHHWGWRIWQSKDLAQLLYSSDVPGITLRDRWRFWTLYLGERDKSHKRGWLRRVIAWRWRKYRRHNDKRRQRHEKTSMSNEPPLAA